MKKFLCAVILVSVMAGCVYGADDDTLIVGFLTRLKTTESEFYNIVKNSWATKGWAILGGDHTIDAAKFYDSLMLMQMAMNRRDIEEMVLPDFVAEYLLRVTEGYEVCCVSRSGAMSLCFGFMKDKGELLQRWNAALTSMRNDLTLQQLEQKYIKPYNPYDYVYGNTNAKDKNEMIIFEKFRGAPTIRVAVTGDLPPVDFVGIDGLPSGYNTAVLAEIGRRLKVNIDTVNVNAGARTSALVSGRVDVVFWYEVDHSLQAQLDAPEGVVLSVPYFSWNTFLHVRSSDDE